MEELILDVHKPSVEDVLRLLKRYKLRDKVTMHDASDDFEVAVGTTRQGLQTLSDARDAWCFSDPRSVFQGMGRNLLSSECAGRLVTEGTMARTCDRYSAGRMALGIAEGDAEMRSGEAIPLEHNLDGLGAISFTKGCYMGQELTARTHFQGTIRKRVAPIEFEASAEDGAVGGQPEALVDASSGKSLGKVIARHGRLGLGLIRLRGLMEKDDIRTKPSSERVKVTIPSWWPSEWYEMAQL